MNLADNFNQEEINLHRAVQLISLTGVNLLEALPDDSQNTQIWNSRAKMILGREFITEKGNYRMAISLSPFSLQLVDVNLKIIESINIGGIDQPALYSIWGDWIANLGVTKELTTKLHYELPENELYSSNLFNGLTTEFSQTWSSLRTMANKAMEVLNLLSGITSEINIWPHHFDTGVYYLITEQNKETTQSIGAGLAMADSLISEPYFYIYGWTKEGKINYDKAPNLDRGEWLTEGWQGAVLKASDTINVEGANSFFDSSYQFLLDQLKQK